MGYFVPEYGLVYRIITYIIFALSFIIVFFTSIYNFIRSDEKVESFDLMVKKALTRYFNRINEKELKSRKLEFYAMYGHYWVELRNYSAEAKYKVEDNSNQSVEGEESEEEKEGNEQKFGH